MCVCDGDGYCDGWEIGGGAVEGNGFVTRPRANYFCRVLLLSLSNALNQHAAGKPTQRETHNEECEEIR